MMSWIWIPERSLLWPIASLLALLVSSEAMASKEEAVELSNEGRKAYNLGEFNEAIEHYKKAYEVYPSPSLLFNIAQAYRKLGECERAEFFYSRYLSEDPNSKIRADVEAHLADLEKECEKEEEPKPAPPPTAPADPPLVVETPVPEPEGPPALPFVLMGSGVLASATGIALVVLHSPQVIDGVRQAEYRDTRTPGVVFCLSGAAIAVVGAVLLFADE